MNLAFSKINYITEIKKVKMGCCSGKLAVKQKRAGDQVDMRDPKRKKITGDVNLPSLKIQKMQRPASFGQLPAMLSGRNNLQNEFEDEEEGSESEQEEVSERQKRQQAGTKNESPQQCIQRQQEQNEKYLLVRNFNLDQLGNYGDRLLTTVTLSLPHFVKKDEEELGEGEAA